MRMVFAVVLAVIAFSGANAASMPSHPRQPPVRGCIAGWVYKGGKCIKATPIIKRVAPQ